MGCLLARGSWHVIVGIVFGHGFLPNGNCSLENGG